jgi:hypothetical protein
MKASNIVHAPSCLPLSFPASQRSQDRYFLPSLITTPKDFLAQKTVCVHIANDSREVSR